MALVNIGFGNMVNSDKIVAVVSPDAAPVKRLVQHAKEAGSVIDATQGRRTKSVIITEEDHVVLSALQPDTIQRRFQSMWEPVQKGEEDEE
ncbi:MAG: DUF370 domain-containing protein [Candidatus Limivivens sp.]|nr:DUF370 domain-containing protein [Candidatus Limivivens sp.]